jgi:hypothetical protein
VRSTGGHGFWVVDNQANVELASWNRFHTRNLAVASALLGCSHVFDFGGHTVRISLPSADALPAGYTPGEHVIGDRLSISGWHRTEDGEYQPLEVYVDNVDVVVSIPGKHAVPEGVLSRSANAYELVPEQQQDHFDKLLTSYGSVARRAFDLWIRTVRWKADAYRIGLSDVSDIETGWSTYLHEKNTRQDVWASGHTFTVYGAKSVAPEQWDGVSAALDNGEQPPIYWDLLYDAMGHLERGDLKRTVVDAAVAAETYMKITVQASLPNGLDEPLKEYINNAQIWRVRDRFFPERLDTQQRKTYKSLRPDLKKLFDHRNVIMHSGQKEGLTAPHCQKIVNSVHELISLEPIKAT